MRGYRENVLLSTEIKDIIVADMALTIAFALVFSGGVSGALSNPVSFLYTIPIAFVAVSFSFILHEYMHKIVAQKFGAVAGFRKSEQGLTITIVSSMFGFLIGIPGATVIYSSSFTRKEEGYVSLAGPLTNFAVFIVFFGAAFFFGGSFGSGSYIMSIISTTLFISVLLAFFNMLPIYPLDGSKVLRWNRFVYTAVMAVIFAFMYVTMVLYFHSYSPSGFLGSLAIMLILALLISSVSGGIFGGMRL